MLAVCSVGSSPHTRGAHGRDIALDHRGGIIPAYAGSTGVHDAVGGLLGDHPRIRGEHGLSDCIIERREGSSPHTRGAHNLRNVHCRTSGIIPAYAGSTSTCINSPFILRDHPRIRGEHTAVSAGGSRVWGSSPHTRGAPPPPHFQLTYRGIIPAYAGSTRIDSDLWLLQRDHPRIRGEHGLPYTEPVMSGSSPHTRGARVVPCRPEGMLGIIPAYAGSTSRQAR